MNATSSIDQRLIQYHARFALVEVLIGILATGSRVLSGWFERAAEAQRAAQARRELRGLDDRYLRDIGLERNDIDRLFR